MQVLVEFSNDAFTSSMMKTASTVVAEAAAAAAANPASGSKGGGGGGTKLRSGKFVGVVDGFKTSLRSLISTLQDGELHFIRCLKPNDEKASMQWDRGVSQRQLKSAGIVQAVAATREGYADHLPPARITAAFGHLVPDVNLALFSSEFDGAAQVLQACGVGEDMFALGKTKVFLRPGVLAELDRLRMEHIAGHATLVQSMVRGALARILLRRLKEAAFRKAEEKRRREEELRRQRMEAERRRLEQERLAAEAKAKAEAEEQERRKQVQQARSMSFDRKRRKKVEEEERKKREEAAKKEAQQAEMAAKRAEVEARMAERLASQGITVGAATAAGNCEPDVSDAAASDDLADLARRTEMAVARAEAEAASAVEASRPTLELPESPSPDAKGGGGGGGGGFMLSLPESPAPVKLGFGGGGGAGGGAAPARLLEQRKLDEVAAKFVCPLEDVLAFAEMIGMDAKEDIDLLWLADEALQAPEPVGWEERQDPRGNTYYCNTITNMTMVQHPVDYHYQQLYLQCKMQRQQQQQAALMSPRSRANFEATEADKKRQSSSANAAAGGGGFKLDLRSVNADKQDGDEPPQTPKGWLRRASSSLLTPRGSSAEVRRAAAGAPAAGAPAAGAPAERALPRARCARTATRPAAAADRHSLPLRTRCHSASTGEAATDRGVHVRRA